MTAGNVDQCVVKAGRYRRYRTDDIGAFGWQFKCCCVNASGKHRRKQRQDFDRGFHGDLTDPPHHFR